MELASDIRVTKKWDLVGISLSVVCGIHCLSVPLLLGVLPLVGLDFVADHQFEWVMMAIIFFVAGMSFFSGYRRHGRKEVLWILLAGVLIFAVLRPLMPENLHPIATISGGLVFIVGHWKNWRWHRPSCPKACCVESRT